MMISRLDECLKIKYQNINVVADTLFQKLHGSVSSWHGLPGTKIRWLTILFHEMSFHCDSPSVEVYTKPFHWICGLTFMFYANLWELWNAFVCTFEYRCWAEFWKSNANNGYCFDAKAQGCMLS